MPDGDDHFIIYPEGMPTHPSEKPRWLVALQYLGAALLALVLVALGLLFLL